MKRKPSSILSVSFLLALSMVLAACGQQQGASPQSSAPAPSAAASEAPSTLTVGGPPSPPSLPILRMIESKAMGENVNIDFKTWESVDNLGALAM
ncbi:MAG: hypothetical protein K0Q90_4543, partial [Paenibacillaceae bacterium]|nr:hypothetical protein [Paenibacillaceae bacterium]